MKGTKLLETERLILRKFKISDAAGMYKNWGSDKKVNKYLEWQTHKNVEDSKNIIKLWIQEYKKGAYNWVVELKETGDVIGSITGVHVYEKENYVEVGYCYGSKYWGNGYATEALKRVIEYFLIDCNMNLVEAKYISGNPKSGMVMKRAGMKMEAILNERMINKYTNKLDDLIIYSITQKEYKKG